MTPGNTITQRALQHFEIAYQYMDGTLAREPQVRFLDSLSKLRFFIGPI